MLPINTNINKAKTKGKYFLPLSPTVSLRSCAIKLYISSEISCNLEGIIARVLTVKVKNKVIMATVITIDKEEFVKDKSNEELKDWWRQVLPILEHNQKTFINMGNKKTKKIKLLERLYD